MCRSRPAHRPSRPRQLICAQPAQEGARRPHPLPPCRPPWSSALFPEILARTPCWQVPHVTRRPPPGRKTSPVPAAPTASAPQARGPPPASLHLARGPLGDARCRHQQVQGRTFSPLLPRSPNPHREAQGVASPSSPGRHLQPQFAGQNSTFGNAASIYIKKKNFCL